MNRLKVLLASAVLIAIVTVPMTQAYSHARDKKTYRYEEVPIVAFQFHGKDNYDIADYAFGVCLIIVDQTGVQSGVPKACDDHGTHYSWPVDVLITRITRVGTTNTGVQPAQSGTDGCALRIVTDVTDTTVVALANGEFFLPPTDSTIQFGEIMPEIRVDTIIPAGSTFGVQAKKGPFCALGAPCVCNSGFGMLGLIFWGRYL